MSQPKEEKKVRDDKWAEEKFPDRGERPSDKIVLDPDATPSPNVGHPE